MTLQTVLERVAEWLNRLGGPINVRDFLRSFGRDDVEAGQLLAQAFETNLLRGRFVSRLVDFDGHISGFADDTRPVWH